MPSKAKEELPARPTESVLATQLGSTKLLWEELLTQLAEHGVDVQEWKCCSRKAGWSLRLKRKDRAIVYLLPGQGCFTASFALGDRAVQAARKSGLPDHVLNLIAGARRYVEDTAVRVEVRSRQDQEVVAALAKIKLAN